MALVITNEGMTILLDHLASNETPGWDDFELRLFQQQHTPAVTDLAEDLLAIEADFSGYAPVELVPDGQAAYAGNTSHLEFVPVEWEVEAPVVGNQIYGWFMLDTATGKLVALQDDPNAPVGMDTEGDKYSILLRLRLGRA